MAFQSIALGLPAQAAAGATAVTPIGVVPSTMCETNWLVQRVSLTAPSLVTGVATNNATFNVRKVTGGTPTTIATITLASGTNLAAEVETVLTPTVTVLLAGDVLDVQMVQNGTGLAIPVGVIAKVELA